MKKVYLILLIGAILGTSNFAKAADLHSNLAGFSIFQAVSEGQFASDGNSYTKKLTEGLSGKADLNNDGKLTLQELRLFLEIDAVNGDLAKNNQMPKSFIENDFTIYDTNKDKEHILTLGKTEFINIAIDRYKNSDFHSLQNAVADAAQMQSVLQAMDKDKMLNIKSLINENATRENIINTINSIDAETVIFYLSGQSSENLFVPFETDSNNLFLSALSTDTFVRMLKHNNKRVLIISDTCLLWDKAEFIPGFKDSGITKVSGKSDPAAAEEILQELNSRPS